MLLLKSQWSSWRRFSSSLAAAQLLRLGLSWHLCGLGPSGELNRETIRRHADAVAAIQDEGPKQMEMDGIVRHCIWSWRSATALFWAPIFPIAVWALGLTEWSSWGPAASIFISLALTPCSYFALYNFTAAIYEPRLWASTAALLLFIAARRDRLSLDPPLQPFYLHLYRLRWCQSISLFSPATHTHTIFFCAGV